LVPKRLELLRELVPALKQVAVFVNPANPSRTDFLVRETESAGRTMGLQMQIFDTGTVREINAAFTTLASQRPDALLVTPDPFFTARRAQIATLAARHGIPTSFPARDYVEAGGLMSYGPNLNDAFRQAGVYTGRVLKGAKIADLPGRAINQVRARHQRANGSDARPHRAGQAARYRRRGDRMNRREFIVRSC
jgi:putative ABC transport system substrate-binding protein